MKKLLLLTAILLTISFAGQTQKKVLLQHAGIPTLYTTISDAITAAVATDTIYIPGYTYNETITLDKQLCIFGTGHYADSTAASGMTQVIGNFYLNTGCDGSKIEGLYTNGYIYTSSQTINNITISRCRIGGQTQLNGTIDGFTISECVLLGTVSSSNSGTATNIAIEKSIIQGQIIYFRNTSLLSHCTLIRNYTGSSSSGYNFYDCQGIVFNSNVILDQTCSIPNTCEFNNNLFRRDFASSMGPDDDDNIFNQDIASIFMNIESGKEYTFDFANDYHLQTSSLGVNAALDGTNVGIYGTANPCKASAVPSNPHFFKVNIASENDADGKLSVELGVQAQDR
ncbi:MAG: hypothetical protein JEZ01_17595 [Labilibaculum sp.]|nr:hypothetical protein [Labilibaculum sp.]MBI9059582.1 hypothetical protein [Labilibaculum sp.]